jgi:DNA recombination protein RmuC
LEVVISMLMGAAIGGIIVWLIASSRAKGSEAVNSELRKQMQHTADELNNTRGELDVERQAKVEALTRFESIQKNYKEQKELFDIMKKEMSDTFIALSSAALKSSSEDFLRLASESLGKVVSETKGKLGEHRAAMDGMIKPLSDSLKRYEEQIKHMEQSRHKAYGSLEEQLRTLAVTHDNLQQQTSNLVSALRKPEVRGRWGEMQLRRVAELSGMSMHCDFTEQESVDTDKGKVRPDMIVHLPNEREIVVDSKVSLEAFLNATAASTEDERKNHMKKHSQQVRAHMNRLASMEYWDQLKKSLEFVILFIPGESFLSAALEADTTLIEDGIQKKVIIATPTTFIALLRAIAYGWRQEQMTKNAQVISEHARELFNRMGTLIQHFENIGSNLEKSVAAYNRAVGSLESRVLPSVRRFKELGVTGAQEMPVMEQIDRKPRTMGLLPEDEEKG